MSINVNRISMEQDCCSYIIAEMVGNNDQDSAINSGLFDKTPYRQMAK